MHKFQFVNRYKFVDEQFLQHSEWNRTLATPSLLGLAGVLSLSFGLFVIAPYVIKVLAGPSASLSLFLAFIQIFISAFHINELICLMPKNCLLYNYVYTYFGEIPAMVIAWNTLLDFLIIISIAARSWSSYLESLFGDTFHRYLVFDSFFINDDSIFDDKIDLCAVIAIGISTSILCCNIRVCSTLAIIMLIMIGFTTSSTILVGFFHIDATNWLSSDFFPYGFSGTINGASCLLISYIGIDVLTYVVEETHGPRKRLSTIFSFIILILTIFLFITVMIITLMPNVYFNDLILLPDIFKMMDVSPARYFMTVGAFFGLSAAILVSFLPVSRLILSLTSDRLLPFKSLACVSEKSGIPRNAILLTGALSLPLIVIEKSTLINIVTTNLSFRLLISACLMYMQYYRSEPMGLVDQNIKYKSIRKKLHDDCSMDYLSEKGSITTERCSSTTYDNSSISLYSSQCLRSFFIRNQSYEEPTNQQVKVSEDTILLQSSRSFYKNILDSQEITLNRASSNTKLQYNTFNKSSKKFESLENINKLYENEGTDERIIHNCLKSPCSPIFEFRDKNRIEEQHIYETDTLEMPFFCESIGADVQSLNEERMDNSQAINILLLFTFLSTISGILMNNIELFANKFYPLLVIIIILTVLVAVGICAALQPTNGYHSDQSCKTPFFPSSTLLSIFLSIVFILSTSIATFYKWLLWTTAGLTIYFIYGMNHSKVRHGGYIVRNHENWENNSELMIVSERPRNLK